MAENMVLIAIIGYVATVVVPTYQYFSTQADVGNGIALAGPARIAIEKTFAELGPGDMAQRAEGKLPSSAGHVQSISIGRDGVVTIRFRFSESIAPADRNQIQIVPVSGGKALDLSDPASKGKKFEWQCGGSAGASTFAVKHRPPGCRGDQSAAPPEWTGWAGGSLPALLSLLPVLAYFFWTPARKVIAASADAIQAATLRCGWASIAYGIRNYERDFVVLRLKALRNPAALGKKAGNWLCQATRQGDVEMVEVLLQHGIPGATRGDGGTTALHEAAWRRQTAILALLLRYGAPADSRDDESRTPLHAASDSESVRLLLMAGANPNAVDAAGDTPLHYLVSYGRYNDAVAEMLLQHGADPSRRNAKGQVPLDWSGPRASLTALIAKHRNAAEERPAGDGKDAGRAGSAGP